MTLNEASIRFLEEHIPELAVLALKQAYWNALASGSSVLMCDKGNLVEIFPDGTRKVIKKIAPPIPVIKGQRIIINE